MRKRRLYTAINEPDTWNHPVLDELFPRWVGKYFSITTIQYRLVDKGIFISRRRIRKIIDSLTNHGLVSKVK